MAFTMPDYPMLRPEQVNPWNAAIKRAFEMYGQGVKSAYLPKTIQADIFSKQFAPLAQIASNPVAMAMMGDQGQGIMNAIQQLLSQNGGNGGSLSGGMGASSPSAGGAPMSGGEGGAGTMGGGGGSNGGAQEIGSTNGSQTPGLPSGDIRQRATQKALAATQEQLHPAGTTFTSDNEALSTPAGNVVGGAQETLNSIANLKDFVPNYAEQAREFTTPSGSLFNRIKSGASAVTGRVGLDKISKLLSKDPDLEGRWNNLVQEKNRLGVIAQHVFPTTNSKEGYEKHMEMLELRPTDTYKSFSNRISEFMGDLEKAEKNAKKAMNPGSSYNLNPESKTIYGKTGSSNNKTFKNGVEKVKNLNGATFHKINGQWRAYLGD